MTLAAARGFRLEVEDDRGGISFPNFLTDPCRIPVIDGLGPVGDGMHTREEWLDLEFVRAPRRAARRPAGVAARLIRPPRDPPGDEPRMTQAPNASERSFRMPHTLVIVGSLIVLVLALSWLLPSGTYQRVEQDGRQITVPGTYQQVEKVYLGPQWLMIAPHPRLPRRRADHRLPAR